MSDIYKIKPVHGWREFIGEVGIIVLGVLIALECDNWSNGRIGDKKSTKRPKLYIWRYLGAAYSSSSRYHEQLH